MVNLDCGLVDDGLNNIYHQRHDVAAYRYGGLVCARRLRSTLRLRLLTPPPPSPYAATATVDPLNGMLRSTVWYNARHVLVLLP
jgi:hypothetical protein